jgi:hypothetical protein
MSWDKRYVEFGLVKIYSSNRVQVFRDRDNYHFLTVGNETITDARWTGDTLTIYLKNGKVRRYRDQDNYTTI